MDVYGMHCVRWIRDERKEIFLEKEKDGWSRVKEGDLGEYFEFMDGWMDDWRGICEMDRKYIEKLKVRE